MFTNYCYRRTCFLSLLFTSEWNIVFSALKSSEGCRKLVFSKNRKQNASYLKYPFSSFGCLLEVNAEKMVNHFKLHQNKLNWDALWMVFKPVNPYQKILLMKTNECFVINGVFTLKNAYVIIMFVWQLSRKFQLNSSQYNDVTTEIEK